MIRKISGFVSVFVLVLAVVAACGKGGGGSPPPIAQKDGADGLKAVFEASIAACGSKDFQKGKALTMSLLPTKDILTKIFKDDTPAEFLDKVAEQYAKLPPSDEKVACIFVAEGRTEIRVHGSSVEDIIANKPGTPAFLEFPGGAKQVAALLKPGTFYEVEVTEPGKDSGTKFHMFFWDGAQWRMLGPAWRALRD